MKKTIKVFLYNVYQFFLYAMGKVKLYRTGEGKSISLMIKELVMWWIKERNFNLMYYMMGLNLKGTDINRFIGRREFLETKNKVEKHLKIKYGCGELNYDVVCKDKFVAGSFFKANNIPCAENLAMLTGKNIHWADAEPARLESILKLDGRFILKNIIMEAGEGTYYLEVQNNKLSLDGNVIDIRHLISLLKPGIWVLQNFMQSHEALRKINSTALNTTRIVTILKDGNPQYLGGFQSFAVNKESTDSWSKGSLSVGIDIETECLIGNGFYNLSVKDKSIETAHPDSGVTFDNYRIPFLRDAVNLCVKAHKLLPFNFVIGWDVAITDAGPVVIEANEKPGMNLVQCFEGGLKKQILIAATQYLKAVRDL